MKCACRFVHASDWNVHASDRNVHVLLSVGRGKMRMYMHNHLCMYMYISPHSLWTNTMKSVQDPLARNPWQQACKPHRPSANKANEKQMAHLIPLEYCPRSPRQWWSRYHPVMLWYVPTYGGNATSDIADPPDSGGAQSPSLAACHQQSAVAFPQNHW
jgi:hypothetical protein